MGATCATAHPSRMDFIMTCSLKTGKAAERWVLIACVHAVVLEWLHFIAQS